MLLTNRQTDKHTNKHYQNHNFLCQEGNNSKYMCGVLCMLQMGVLLLVAAVMLSGGVEWTQAMDPLPPIGQYDHHSRFLCASYIFGSSMT